MKCRITDIWPSRRPEFSLTQFSSFSYFYYFLLHEDPTLYTSKFKDFFFKFLKNGLFRYYRLLRPKFQICIKSFLYNFQVKMLISTLTDKQRFRLCKMVLCINFKSKKATILKLSQNSSNFTKLSQKINFQNHF